MIRPLRNALKGFVSCITALLVTAAAFAGDSYPTRPIRLVVGFGAGGPTDIPARFIADRLASMLGQSVVVENKPGAGGMLATRDVLAQPRDGYNLLLCTHFESINTVLYKNPQYTLADLAPISLITKYYYALALSNAIPAANLEQFLAYAKSHPGEVSYITIGSGSAQEILAHQLERLAGISLNRIPYRGGPQVMQDLVSGRVHLYVSPALGVLPQYQSKDIKILGVSSPQRLTILPEVPTFAEQGIDFKRFGWLGVCAGAGTPQPIIDLLNRHIMTIVASPDYQTLIETAGSIPASSSPAEVNDVLKQTVDDVAATIREYGMQQE
ncbi:MAG: tripartite tricarboxylate transporter substrate binding protein [Xanthobacteraceae bacterium]|nr:tripartite tricarboxylate transporter substrate binding protein [Xanthobacteraceae bacterium]MBV9239524.1 tripartite tricarboxylate transporter substrate binding protein [Xanthobacteraceae bacterium]MBV9627845.1 tripartite tricarboxylate transporter substrate binding protein [Xanthobacteraceae bacterium]